MKPIKKISFYLSWNLFILFSLLMCSCETNHIENIDTINYEPISDIPSIELDSISNTDVIEYIDSIILKISYQDGDGDLGSLNPDATSIELIDNRNPDVLKFNYHLSPRAPAGSNIAIQGELDIKLNNTILLNENNNSEETTFSIRIKDEADNWSNVVTSPTVTIRQ